MAVALDHTQHYVEKAVSDTSVSEYPKNEGYALSVLTLIASLFAGYELVFRYDQVYGDAVSRVLSGLYMTWGGQFHLAAMSFYWSPLISLLSIPFALARGLWGPLMTYGFAANILSACFAAVGVYHLNRILWRFGLTSPWRITWSLLYFLNPLILLYSSNGMSDGMECALFLATLDGLIEYLQTQRLIAVVRSASWLSAAFMVRYESVAFGAALTIGLVLALWRYTRDYRRVEGVVLALLFPVICAGIIWILLGWMIMHDPLYFLNSKYSNGSQISSGTYNYPQVMQARHHIGVTLYQVARFMGNFWAYAPAALIVAVLQFRRKPNPIGLSLLAASVGVPLLQVVLLYSHRSADWQRFFIYYVPFGFVLCGYLLWKLPMRTRSITAALASVVFIACNYYALTTMKSVVWGNGDTGAYRAVFKSSTVSSLHVVNDYQALGYGVQEAHYINSHPNLRVLADTFQSWSMMAYIQHSNQVVFTNQPDFKAVLENPRGRVNAILTVPDNAYSEQNDTLNATYPQLWSGHLSWTRLIHQWPNGDRLFAVLQNAP